MHWRRQAAVDERFRWLLSDLFGSLLARVATDVTHDSARRSCLVLAPHPDDETLGCGATIARRIEAGTEVHVMVMSDGATWPVTRTPEENIAARHAELLRAIARLGVPEDAVVHHAFPETELAGAVGDMADAISDAVRRTKPDDVLTTSPADPHEDHAALGRATLLSLGSGSPRLLAYPVWQWEHPRSWARTLAASGRPEFVSTAGFLARKKEALAEFSSQIAMTKEDATIHVMHPFLLRHFLTGREVFFPIRPDGGPTPAPRGGDVAADAVGDIAGVAPGDAGSSTS